jgi:hypothetical protein
VPPGRGWYPDHGFFREPEALFCVKVFAFLSDVRPCGGTHARLGLPAAGSI